MFGSSKSQKTPWETTDGAVEDLLQAACTLHKTVEPQPDRLGILGAGSIGVKAESVRKAIDRLKNAVLSCAAAESDGKMQYKQVESVVERLDNSNPLFVTVLERLSEVHFHHFHEIGMGIPTVVKKALGWIQGSIQACLTTLSNANKISELTQRISTVGNRLLAAVSKALAVYSNTTTPDL
ncbi:hypothetical protein FACUT_1225 [Fusarium acutatum]|uniref:Uncharacterized protein n=1 Tax=Fusarium acutatum TaxID=78861 RepID=A0A8H4K6B9_9HYPO|nr:hypothetical protein FACUT_1225 [Fusarium acutatum]